MARIRTVKPDFFRHEELQDLENAHPTARIMLVFAALWGHCDKTGRFPWKPRSLKLDILPFLDFDLNASLLLLWENHFLERYEIEGEQYGLIPTFREHQRISGKEAQEPSKYPEPKDLFPRKQTGNDGEAPGKHPGAQEGKGREEEGSVPNGTGADAPPEPELPPFLDRRPKPANGTDDPVKALFDLGVATLAAGGTSERQARSLVGKWRKDIGDDTRLLGLFMDARKQSAVEPVAWLTKAVAGEITRKRFGSGYVPPGVGG